MAELDTNTLLLQRGHKIPEPAKFSHIVAPVSAPGNLADQMKLGKTEADLRTFCKLVARIANLSEEYREPLQLHRIIVKSPDWQTFVEIVKRELPLLHSYENAWPVIAIVREHRLRSIRRGGTDGLLHWDRKIPTIGLGDPRRLRIRLLRNSSEGSQVSSSSGAWSPGVRGDAVHVSNPPSMTSRSSTASGSSPLDASSPTTTACTSLRPSATDSTRKTADGYSTAPRLAGHDLPQGGFPGSGDRLKPVLAFLSALRPEQSGLLPVLASKGIADGAALDGFARFPARQRKVLLNSWLREETITELQFEVLNAGFESMGAEAGKV